MKKRNILIAVFVFLIFIIIASLAVTNKNDIEHSNDTSDLAKLHQYVNLQTKDYEANIKKRGYVTQDDAIKIVALSTVKINNLEISVKEYITSYISANEFSITLDETQSPYWNIRIGTTTSSYTEWAIFKVDYYTGNLLYNYVEAQLSIG